MGEVLFAVPALLKTVRLGCSPRSSAWLFLGLLLAWPLHAEERRGYEGVVSLKQRTIGTVILVDIADEHTLSGWVLLGKLVPIDQGSVVENGVEFTAGGNTYRIDERRGRINYSGPDGDGDRLLDRLTAFTGKLQELLEATRESGNPVAVLEVDGRRRELKYDEPVLWKRTGPSFEQFSRLDELLGKNITVWAADVDLRGGSMVAIEEPEGVDIPIKAPKKPKEKKPKK